MSSQLFKRPDADRHAIVAPAGLDRALSEADLDQVAAAGGKAGSSTNPVED